MILKNCFMLFLVTLLSFLPIACSSKQGVQEGGQAPTVSGEEPSEAQAEPQLDEWPGTERWTGDLDGMRERRVIRALVPYNRVYYFFAVGRPRGAAVESLAEFEKFVNRKLNPKDRTCKSAIRVVLVPVTHQAIPRAIVEGRGDLAVANLSISPERLQIMDFSVPIYEDVEQILVTGPASPQLNSLDDLCGQEIWAKASSTHHRNLRNLSDALVKRGKPPINLRDADENLEDDDILEMVAAGNYSTTAMDRHIADFWAQVLPGLKPRQDLVLSTGGRKGWAFRKKSPKLAALVNEFVKDHRVGTLYGNILVQRYLKGTKYVRNAALERTRARFRELSALFQKYAGMYDLPWLLVVAQSYQESQFDHSARSPAGAVGIMQVLPSTAASPPVNIKNIARLENNVHAGVRLLKFIRDDYFKDDPMDEVNRTLMAVAAYNAGPARIASCRKRAAGMGLDPNVWFGNVEFAVAKVVGRETVQYVSNIYKYYLTFKVTAERMEQRRQAIEAVKE